MNILGIDIGGTSIKFGVVNEEGKVNNCHSLPINKKLDQNEQIKQLLRFIKDIYKNNFDFTGIGIGIPGSINSELGEVEFSNNLHWKNFKIVNLFNNEFAGIKIKITNDANAAALAEAKFGSAKGEKNVVLLTLGTGVGSGIIINGKLYEGNKSRGAEIGHSLLVMDGIKCTCGRKGCLEMYASASALCSQANKAIKQFPNSQLAKNINTYGKIDGKIIFDSMKEGCKIATNVINTYIKYLSEGIINICNIFRPSSVVLSGGIANQKEILTNKINQYLKDNNYGFPPACKVDVKCSELGANTGIIGAASLLLE